MDLHILMNIVWNLSIMPHIIMIISTSTSKDEMIDNYQCMCTRGLQLYK